MKKLFFTAQAVLLLFGITAFAESKPVMHFDFSKTGKDGMVPNLGSGPYRAKVSGKYKVLPGGILQMDGLTTKVMVEGSEKFDVSKNATFTLLYKREELPGNTRGNRAMDGFFSKAGEFILTKYNNNLYSNICINKHWVATWQIFDMFRPIDTSWLHVAITVQYFVNPAEAEKWIEISYYLNGVPAGRRRFKDIDFPHAGKQLEIAGNTCMGPQWMTGGKIASPMVWQEILSEEQIRTLVLEQKLAKPAFKQDKVITPAQEKLISSAAKSPAVRSALRNICRSDSEHFNADQILRAPGKYLRELKSRSTSIVLLNKPGFVHPVAFFDNQTGRELLRAENPFTEWSLNRKKELYTFQPYDKEVTSSLKSAPEYSNGAWKFTISYKHPDFQSALDFCLVNDRLEMKIHAAPTKGSKMLYSVSFPKFSLNPLTRQNETLITPYGCGVAHPKPTTGNVRFSNPYPRAFTTMQLFSYYDKDTGVYMAAEDPKGRVKHLDASASKKNVTANFIWRVPYDKPATVNPFAPQCNAALEVFRGDWYDAGLIYRRELARSNASWWKKTLPNTDTPEYFRNNSIFVAFTYLGELDPNLIPLRKYLKMEFMAGDIWKWWEEGRETHLTPVMRAQPEWIEFVRTLRKEGIRLLPYTDGRLWAALDRRNEDYLYSKIAAGITVQSEGKKIFENYRVPCAVLCPATANYQKSFFDFITRLTSQGVDGLYVDQWGATYHPLCDLAKEHGHRYADNEAWVVNGYHKLIRNLRKFWASRGEQKLLTTEDNSEWCVGFLDAVEVYRWTTQNQVPLFPLVYSGRVQMYARHARTIAARFQTVAEQLNNSEQLGKFGIGELASPFNAELRHYVKRLAWVRKAMLPFFNEGMMSRPPVFAGKLPVFTRFWSDFGTRNVGKPQVQSSAWKYQNCTAALLVNTEASAISNTVSFTVPGKDHTLYIFTPEQAEKSCRKQGSVIDHQFTLPPRSCALLLAVPRGEKAEALLKHIRKCFVHVRETLTEKDPFTVENLPATTIIPGNKGINLTDSAVVIGARRNRFYDRIDYVSHAMLYPGVVDFGKTAPEVLHLELACGTPQGGKIKIYADGITDKHLIGVHTLSPYFKTKSWNDYIWEKVPLKKRLTGKHKLIFLVEGLGFVNLKHWKLQ